MTLTFNRRSILKGGLATVTASLLPLGRLVAGNEREQEPHFFLHVVYLGGVDCTYLFDARPLSMTDAGWVQNYLKEEPRVWTGTNGTATLASSITDPLQPHRDSFSIINGVWMAFSADGHTENQNFLATNSILGGESFLRRLVDRARYPIDFLQIGRHPGVRSHNGRRLELEPSGIQALMEAVQSSPAMDPSDPVLSFLERRMEAVGAGTGEFSFGASEMRAGLKDAPGFGDKLGNVELSDDGTALDKGLRYTLEIFRTGVAPAAMMIIDRTSSFDTHEATAAKAQPKAMHSLVSDLVAILTTLRETPFDGTRSYFDVTTLLILSEFGRTMRQLGRDIDDTGTDHNRFTNSVLVAGKGIRPNLVLGASDLAAVDSQGALTDVSVAHRQLDPGLLHTLGRPFDFATAQPRADLPFAYEPSDYLNHASVINTLFRLFSVPGAAYWTFGNQNQVAPTIPALLASH